MVSVASDVKVMVQVIKGRHTTGHPPDKGEC